MSGLLYFNMSCHLRYVAFDSESEVHLLLFCCLVMLWGGLKNMAVGRGVRFLALIHLNVLY